MLIVYYKTPKGKITNAHKLPSHINAADAPKIVEEYNNKPENEKQKAYIADLQEGSLERYLYERSERKIQYSKEAIEDAIDALDRARDCINCLEAAPTPKENRGDAE